MKGRLVAFLKEELQISSDVIMVGLRHCEEDISLLPMILWQYGLVTIEQLGYIWDWLEIHSNSINLLL